MAAEEIETAERPGGTRSERRELVRLRRENRQLRMERDIRGLVGDVDVCLAAADDNESLRLAAASLDIRVRIVGD